MSGCGVAGPGQLRAWVTQSGTCGAAGGLLASGAFGWLAPLCGAGAAAPFDRAVLLRGFNGVDGADPAPVFGAGTAATLGTGPSGAGTAGGWSGGGAGNAGGAGG